MSPLTKIGRHCAICVLTFCAALISPVILIYGPLIAIGVMADVVRAGNSPIAAAVIASAVAFLTLRKAPVRALLRRAVVLASAA